MSLIISSKTLTFSDKDYTMIPLFSTAATDFSVDPAAYTYKNRVIADGGLIQDFTEINTRIKMAKAQGWLTNCKLWYMGAGGRREVSNLTEKWYNIINETGDASQSSAGSRPTFSTNVRNGQPGFNFTSAKTLSMGNVGSLFTNSAASMFVVIKLNSTDAEYSPMRTISNDSWMKYVSGESYSGLFRTARIGGLGPGSFADNGTHIMTVISGGSYWMYQDGILKITTTANWNAGNDHAINDTSGAANRGVDGYICELIVLGTAADDATRQQIEAYLVSKYAII